MKLSPEAVLSIAATQWGGLAPQPSDILRALDVANYKIVDVSLASEPCKQRQQPIDPFAIVDEICERRGITHTELCRGAGIAPSTLNKAYRGGRETAFHIRTLNKILEWDNAQP